MKRFLSLVSERPGLVLVATLALTLLALTGLVSPGTGQLRLRIDPSSEGLLPPGGEQRSVYERSRRMLGGEDPIVVALGAGDVFYPDTLRRVVRLTERLEQVEGVRRVVSLATAQDVRSAEGDLHISPFIEEVPEEPSELSRLRSQVLENPMYRGTLAARDGRATALLVYLDEMSDVELIDRKLDERIAAIAGEEAGSTEVWISGFPHFKAIMNATLRRQLALALPAVVVFLALALGVAFRSVRGVLVPLATIALALVWTLGAIGWAGGALNVITTIVPPLIMTLGFAYTMHVVFDYYHVVREAPPTAQTSSRKAVREALETVGVPVLVTGITTAAGFLALSISPIPAIREFGLFSVMGVVFTVLAALTFAPAALALLPLPEGVAEPRAAGRLDWAARRLADFNLRRRRHVIAGAFVLLLVAGFGMSQIRVASHFLTAFHSDAPVRRHFDAINERLAGANALQILVETDVRDGLLEPENMRALLSLQEWLEAQREVGETNSIVDYVMLLNRAFHDDDASYFRVPERKRLASQLLLIGGGEESARLIDGRRRIANITVLAKVGDSGSVGDLVTRIESRLNQLPAPLRAAVTGNMVLVSSSVNDVARGQWYSLLVAFGMIYLVLAILFTSFRVGFVALLPNLLPIAIYFGALGLTGITLNTSTSLVGCLALGIAVDDTIHYFARFNADAKRLADERVATRETLRGLIHPVTFTTVGLCLGFLVLTTSELRPQVEFGALAAFTLAVAWLVDVTLSPALCAGLRIVTFWDLLTLDLGSEPQRSIALFHGLSVRQARVFTLMSSVREIAAGEALFRAGDKGREMYVILDGTLGASIRREGKRVELAHMSRGDTVGEIGLFAEGRSADVDALSDARLIGFGPTDLERLRRRYPRVAAAVYRNLNRIQAERLTRMTKQVR